MTVRKPTFRAQLADGSEHVVEVIHGDQLRAELEAPKHGIPVDPAQAPLHTTTLWLWASLTRTKVVSSSFQAFRTELVGVNRVQDDDPAEPAEPVDPTMPAQLTTGP